MFKRALIIMLILLILAMIHLAIYAQTINLGYKISNLRKDLEKIRSQNRELWSVVARKESLDRIEKIATTKLGMVKPEKIHYLYATPESVNLDRKEKF